MAVIGAPLAERALARIGSIVTSAGRSLAVNADVALIVPASRDPRIWATTRDTAMTLREIGGSKLRDTWFAAVEVGGYGLGQHDIGLMPVRISREAKALLTDPAAAIALVPSVRGELGSGRLAALLGPGDLALFVR